MSKSVDEYFRDIEGAWEARGLTPDPLPWAHEVFTFDEEADAPYTRGWVAARLSFPGHPDAYVQATETVRVVGNHMEREEYSYELIVGGARLENWHRHGRRSTATSDHERPHRHRGSERLVVPRSISHKDMLDACFHALADLPQEDSG